MAFESAPRLLPRLLDVPPRVLEKTSIVRYPRLVLTTPIQMCSCYTSLATYRAKALALCTRKASHSSTSFSRHIPTRRRRWIKCSSLLDQPFASILLVLWRAVPQKTRNERRQLQTPSHVSFCHRLRHNAHRSHTISRSRSCAKGAHLAISHIHYVAEKNEWGVRRNRR
jgi:hypothetical protein